MSVKRRILVVGGGVAGGAVAVNLSKRGYDVVLVSEHPYVYSKMTLSYALKMGVSSVEPYVIYRADELRSLGITFVNDVVDYVDASGSVAVTKGGCKIEYDDLVLATGGKVSMPRIEGLGLKGVYTFLSFEDLVKLNEVARPNRRAVIIGAGMVGTLAADGLRARGLKVTLVDVLPYPLLTAVEEPIAKVMLSRFRSSGVTFLGSAVVEGLAGEKHVEYVVLADGERIPADIVVVATGVTANVPGGLEFLREGPGNSVLTNERLATKVPNIYAVGDCASSLDYISGRPVYRPIGIIASYGAKIIPDALGGAKYRGFLAYQVEEAFGYTFMRLGLNGFECRRLGVSYSKAIVEYKAPGVKTAKSLVLFEKGTDRLLGWQSIGAAMASYKSKIFESMIKSGLRVEDLQEKGFKVIEKID